MRDMSPTPNPAPVLAASTVSVFVSAPTITPFPVFGMYSESVWTPHTVMEEHPMGGARVKEYTGPSQFAAPCSGTTEVGEERVGEGGVVGVQTQHVVHINALALLSLSLSHPIQSTT